MAGSGSFARRAGPRRRFTFLEQSWCTIRRIRSHFPGTQVGRSWGRPLFGSRWFQTPVAQKFGLSMRAFHGIVRVSKSTAMDGPWCSIGCKAFWIGRGLKGFKKTSASVQPGDRHCGLFGRTSRCLGPEQSGAPNSIAWRTRYSLSSSALSLEHVFQRSEVVWASWPRTWRLRARACKWWGWSKPPRGSLRCWPSRRGVSQGDDCTCGRGITRELLLEAIRVSGIRITTLEAAFEEFVKRYTAEHKSLPVAR